MKLICPIVNYAIPKRENETFVEFIIRSTTALSKYGSLLAFYSRDDVNRIAFNCKLNTDQAQIVCNSNNNIFVVLNNLVDGETGLYCFDNNIQGQKIVECYIAMED